MSEVNVPTRLVITCVHGTWGRGFFPRKGNGVEQRPRITSSSKGRWFESGSNFQQSLAEALAAEGLQAEFDHFEWSGANSILQRDAAAEALAQFLRSQSKRLPGYGKVVIAHSHGGNVVLRALSRVGDLSGKLYVVTLATPFVQVSSGKAMASTATAVEYALASLFFVLGALGLIIGTLALFGSIIEVLEPDGQFSPFSAGLVSLIAFAISGVAIFGLKKRQRVSRWFVGLTQDESKFSSSVLKLCKASTLPVMSSPLRPLLVLRGIDDEAAFALTAGAIGARLSRLVMGVLDNLEGIAYLGGLFLFLPMIVLVGTLENILGAEWSLTSWLFYSLLGLGLAFFVGLPLLIALSVLLCSFFKSVFGRELLHGSVFLDVVSNSTPDCIGHVDTLTLPNQHHASVWLRHYLYAHPLVSETIATWLSTNGKDSRVRRALARLIDSYNRSSKESL